MTDLFMLHSDYERRHEDEAAMAATYEKLRRQNHESRHGTLEGYVPLREFPCLGSLRIVATDTPGPRMVVCDKCEYVTSIPARRAEPAPAQSSGSDW